LQPDHNNLWHFWRDNQKALRTIFKKTVQLAARTDAVGLAQQALDGTKIEAAASGQTGWSKEYMEKLLAQLDAALDQIELKVVEENADVAAPGYRLPVGLAQLEADGRQHYHPVEPEAWRMKVGQTNRFACNAQAVADAQEDVIVACDASRQETDGGQLVPLIEQARANLGVVDRASRTDQRLRDCSGQWTHRPAGVV